MTTAADVARLFLQDVGAPVSAGNLRAVETWIHWENPDPTRRNNPLNLHSNGGLTGQIGSANVGAGDRNVAVFDTIEHGVAADANNLLHQGSYGAAVSALRADNPTGFLTAIAASPWSAGHYRTSAGTGNKLLNAYLGSGSASYGAAQGSQGGATPSTGWQPSSSLIASATAALAAYPKATAGASAPAGPSPLLLAVVAVIIVAAVI